MYNPYYQQRVGSHFSYSLPRTRQLHWLVYFIVRRFCGDKKSCAFNKHYHPVVRLALSKQSPGIVNASTIRTESTERCSRRYYYYVSK